METMKYVGCVREQLEVKSGLEVAWASGPWGRTRAGKMPARSLAGRPCLASSRLVAFTFNCIPCGPEVSDEPRPSAHGLRRRGGSETLYR